MQKKLTTIAIILALFVIVLGAYTRLADAGLGCPDWPGCYGQVLAPEGDTQIAKAEARFPDSPVDTKKAKIEMIHRYFAGTLGLLIFVLFAGAIKQRRHIILTSTLASLVVFQALLGMWTVTMKLLPLVVMSHLLGGLSILGLLTLYKLKLKYSTQEKASEASVFEGNKTSKSIKHATCLKYTAITTLVLLIFQIFLGGWTSTNYAALTCYDFPYCQGVLFPAMDYIGAFNLLGGIGLEQPHLYMSNAAKVTVNTLHRFTAVILFLFAFGLMIKTLKNNELSKKLKIISVKLNILLLTQIILGICNIILVLPIHVATTHNAVAALLLITTICYNFHLQREIKC